jgi:hypothetical protein
MESNERVRPRSFAGSHCARSQSCCTPIGSSWRNRT